jgi:tripartite-type tricarboxylate transporter receptor subunit TctC
MSPWFRLAGAIAGVLLWSALHAPAAAQSYPARPLRLVVPFGAGTATDLVARHVGMGLASELGQPVAVENRPGGGGMIGAEAVARSAPDGYTIVMGTSASHATSVSLFKKVPFDPIADFAPIARISIFPAVLVVHQSIPAGTVAELIAYAKARPGQLNYATSGPGSQNHLQAAMLAVTAGLQVQHVPFKDAGQIFGAVNRGEVAFLFYPFSALGPVIQGGKVNVIASTGEKRSPLTPNAPTMVEAGYPELTLSGWNALYAPAGTPADIIDRLNAATGRALENAEMRAKLGALGVDLAFGSPRDLAAFTRAEIERYRKLVALAQLKPE